jgi:hypothetical protein
MPAKGWMTQRVILNEGIIRMDVHKLSSKEVGKLAKRLVAEKLEAMGMIIEIPYPFSSVK